MQVPWIYHYEPNMHEMYEITPTGQVVWQYPGLAFPHEGIAVNTSYFQGYFIADTGHDQVIMLNSSLQPIWYFRPNLINWTQLNPEWDKKSYEMNPISQDWTHINHVDFINGSQYNKTFDSLLISIRNFNMTILVNFTAEFNELQSNDEFGSTQNVYWWIGSEILWAQHGPQMMPNGDILVADSRNGRIVEVNQTTKEIVFSLAEAGGIPFRWPRDADYLADSDTFLVTDSFNNRVIECTRTGQILWEYSKDLALPYEAQLLPNGHVLISSQVSGALLEITRPGEQLVWSYNANSNHDYFLTIIPCVIVFILSLASLEFLDRFTNIWFSKKNKSRVQIRTWIYFSVLTIGLIFGSVVLSVIKTLVYAMYPQYLILQNNF
jgi:outer membrane protein assembly factor BamB